MREVDPLVPPGPKLRAQSSKRLPAAICAVFVIAKHAIDGWVMIQQACGGWRGHDVDGTKALSEYRKQRGSEYHIAQKGGLNDQHGRTVGRSNHGLNRAS